ncbi:hypothetical protein PFISCL1PPCAC_23929, partial [Pristionchus fissidentatus]
KVCIIGAGVAGLSSARLLHKSSLPFVVVEGSERIGGRVYPFEYSLIFESVGDFDLFSQFVDVHMEEADLSVEDKASFSSFVADLEEIYSSAAEKTPSVSVKEAFERDFNRFIESSPDRQNRRPSFESLARFYLSYYEMEWAANCEKMALANFSVWDDDSSSCAESFALDSRGYKRIIDVLVEGIPKECIRLGATVTSVNYENEKSVLVKFADGMEEEFGSVIVTSSLGYLKKHAATMFTPPLSEKKIQAIEAIGFGDMQKLFLEYDTPFWDDETESIKTMGVASSPLLGRGNLFEVVDWSPKTLTLWLSGPAVEYASTRSDEQLKEEITLHLRKALGDDAIDAPTQIMRHCWKADPLVLGSYSYLTPESVKMEGANESLAQPILSSIDGRPLVCFAGEATHSTFYQTTCGAYLSGEREANRL